MALCEVSVNNDDENYIGDYSEENNILNLDIHNYSDMFGGIESHKDIKYKPIIIKDYKSKFFAYSPIFYNTGSFYGAISYESYKSEFYFKTNKVEYISDFNEATKYNAITFYHPMLINYFTNPCLSMNITDDYFQYKVKRKEIDKKEIEINKNNISKIVFSGNYSLNEKEKYQNINIQTENFIKIYLTKEIDYEKLLNYIHEMNIYLNAYFPISLKSYDTYVTTSNGNNIQLIHKLLGDTKYYKKPHYNFIKTPFFEFLENMYSNIEYRTSPNKNKFLPFEFKIPTSLEDKFLFYFRYIDMFVGDKLSKLGKPKSSNYERLEHFIDNNKELFDKLDLENENFIKEINSLRNHYIHEGYYLPNNKFEVKEKQKLLYEKEMDYNWLYKITKSLKFGVYKLIYKEILCLDIDESELHHIMNLI